MKHDQGKIKKEHHTLKEFEAFLQNLQKLPEVKRIIPGRISRQQKGSSHTAITISYPTESGIKCIMKKGSTAQELFIVCDSTAIEKITSFTKEFNK